MKAIVGLIAAVAVLGLSTATAEPYKDYTPQKGAWQVTAVHVDSNHIDDYLTGLKTSWVTGAELAKKHGLIDDYYVMVKVEGAGAGVNVLLGQHYTSLAALEPDMARDQMMQKEGLAMVSKEKGAALVAGYEKYRTFVDDGLYQVMQFPK